MDHFIELALALCQAVDSGLSRRIRNRIRQERSGYWASPVIPSATMSIKDFFLTNQLIALRKKLPSTDKAHEKSLIVECQQRFVNNELACYETNHRIVSWMTYGHTMDDEQCKIINRARSYIARVLGVAPNLCEIDGRFGPGTCTEYEFAQPTIADKLDWKNKSCSKAIAVHSDLLQADWIGMPKMCDHSRFTTVEKDHTKRRGISVEPLINTYYQLGIQAYMVRRLQRAPGLGLLRPDSQADHRYLAQVASVVDQYSTIDLSDASDLVSLMLVKLLMPSDWFDLLMEVRVPYISGIDQVPPCLRGEEGLLVMHKYAGMGNGTTFAVETIIFAALCYAVTGRSDLFSVYGDDIIIHKAYAKDLLKYLRMFGLKVNEAKSFIDGDFKESCGGDYLRGVPVRAHYVKDMMEEIPDLFTLHNGLRKRMLDSLIPKPHVVLELILSRIPTRDRIFGPEHLGDTVLHGHAEPIRRGEFLYWKTLKLIGPRRVAWGYYPDVVRYLFCLYTQRSYSDVGMYDNGLVPRGDVTGYKHTWVPLYNDLWFIDAKH